MARGGALWVALGGYSKHHLGAGWLRGHQHLLGLRPGRRRFRLLASLLLPAAAAELQLQVRPSPPLLTPATPRTQLSLLCSTLYA